MSAPRCTLGVDLGTGSLKCVVMGDDGRVLATSGAGYPTRSPHPGWAEQDPVDWVDALKAALAGLARQDPGVLGRVVAIGVCSASHIPVLLDETDRVLRPAILWSDQRSGTEVAALAEAHGDTIAAVTLNEPGCTWTLPQLRWVQAHEPEVIARTRTLLDSKGYLVFRLTGARIMDHGSAAATLMFDARAKRWSPALANLSHLPAAALPPLRHAVEIVGVTSPGASEGFGLPAGLPVVAGTIDSAAEMVGCGLLAPGGAGMIRVGSAGGVMTVTDRPAWHRGVITYPHVVAGRYYKQAGTNACATSLKWLRDLCLAMRGGDAPVFDYASMDALAGACGPGAEGLVFHPYLQGERAPWWNPALRGSFTGLDLRHGWPHIVRAVMEGVAFSLRDGLAMFEHEGLTMDSAVISGGVVHSPVWSGIIADVLGLPTRTVRNGDSALGAAMLAAVGAGLFDTVESAAATCVVPDAVIEPDHLRHERYKEVFRRYRLTARFLDELSRLT